MFSLEASLKARFLNEVQKRKYIQQILKKLFFSIENLFIFIQRTWVRIRILIHPKAWIRINKSISEHTSHAIKEKNHNGRLYLR
jgi:hypothetical protein